MKVCTRCKIEKPKTEFSKKANSKDGLRTGCKACAAAQMTKWHAANSEKRAAYKAEYRSSNIEKIAVYGAKYRAANRAKIAARKAEYRSANPEKVAAIHAKYQAANPEKGAEHRRNRKARVRNAEGEHASADILAILAGQRGLCANCQTKLFKSGKQKYHVDHVMPLVLGGSNWPTNLQCLCPTCNLSKGAKHPDEWAKENGRLL